MRDLVSQDRQLIAEMSPRAPDGIMLNSTRLLVGCPPKLCVFGPCSTVPRNGIIVVIFVIELALKMIAFGCCWAFALTIVPFSAVKVPCRASVQHKPETPDSFANEVSL